MIDVLTILLVDDSPYDRGMVRRELKQEFGNVEIVEATDEDEFKAALDAAAFDLVITDFQIRWTDGLQVYQAVRRRLPNCPVLMFTATGDEGIAVEAMKSGLDDYIIKNVSHLVRLRAAVHAALKNSQARAHAEHLESRLASLLEHLKVGVLRRRSDGRLVEVNDAAADIFGLAKEDVLSGRKISDLLGEPVVQSEREPCVGDPVGELELPARRHDGRPIFVTINESAVVDSSGELLVEGLLEDVTARREAEDEVLRLQTELAHFDRLNSMAEMATGIAHELSQPLTAIANYSAACELLLLQRDDDRDQKLVDMVVQIKEMAHQSGGVIRGLREFTQRRPARSESFSMIDLVTSAVSMLTFELRRNAVTVDLDFGDDLPAVLADQVQVRQVLINLMANAIDAMAAGEQYGRQMKISVSWDDGWMKVSVADLGTGLDESRFEQLFEPFVSTKPHGTGIGLAISRRIVESHGGTLTARNNELRGATFAFTLPLVQ